MPQIELMQSDLPHTLYKTKGSGKKAGTVLTDDVLQKQMEANRRARERHGRRTVDDLFNSETN